MEESLSTGGLGLLVHQEIPVLGRSSHSSRKIRFSLTSIFHAFSNASDTLWRAALQLRVFLNRKRWTEPFR